MNKIPTTVWLFGSILIGGGLLVLLAVLANNKAVANVSLPIEITEYFDYRCVHCADFFPTLNEISEEYGSNVQVNYKYFPVISPIEEGIEIAEAAEAARIQGKFQEFHNEYFTVYNNLRNNIGNAEDLDLEKIATKIGLDLVKFNSDRQLQSVKDIVAQHQAEAAKLGVNSTPTVFVEGQKAEIGVVSRETGQVDYTPFRQLIKKYVDAGIANQSK